MGDSLTNFASMLADPLFLAGLVIIVGFAGTQFAFKGRPIARILCQLGFAVGLTIALVNSGVVPYVPTPDLGGTKYFVISLYKIIWWIAASRLLAGFIRAFMILEAQPKELRLLHDLLAGLIYLGAFFAIVTYV